jgi:two-component system C4-dicarboxylate transport sensor histidine kinase DctB
MTEANTGTNRSTQLQSQGRPRFLLLLSGLWVLPLLVLGLWLYSSNLALSIFFLLLALVLAPLPCLMLQRKQDESMKQKAARAEELAEQLRLQLETVRFRTARLREELQAADRQARMTHQLSLLGQFTAGFMHEFNNPLAIVAGRLEVLLDERKEDATLCNDLEQMLKETRYMGNIARTLLQALRRERSSEVFEPSSPAKPMDEAVHSLRAVADEQGTEIVFESADVPQVDVPEHVIAEVVRCLLTNALNVLKQRKGGRVTVRLNSYQAAGARVLASVEDNGPGVPEEIRKHLFEPFVTQSTGRERLGLGLFLAASLLDMYEAKIRYQDNPAGGAVFVLELPPTRFTRGQHYHWFAGGSAP